LAVGSRPFEIFKWGRRWPMPNINGRLGIQTLARLEGAHLNLSPATLYGFGPHPLSPKRAKHSDRPGPPNRAAFLVSALGARD
jgi:hypothetical protein